MLPDFLPAAETLAKGVKHIACYVADAISERRNGFSDDEAGDYLACAGADALAESLGRMESDGPDAADAWHWCIEHNMRTIRCARMPHAEGDEWTPAATPRAADDPAAEVSDGLIPPMAPPIPAGSPTCKHCSSPIELYTDETKHGRVAVWLHTRDDGQVRIACKPTYATPQ